MRSVPKCPGALVGLVATVCLLLVPDELKAGQDVTLAWDINNSPEIAGYRVYYRSVFETTDTIIDVGRQHTVTLRNLLPETRFVSTVTAYNQSGLESAPSNEISFTTNLSDLSIKGDTEGPTLTITGKPGRTIDVYGSGNLQDWILLGTVTNITGTVEFSPTPDVGPSGMMFYRLESRGESFAAWLAAGGDTGPFEDEDQDGINPLQTFTSGADLFPSPREASPAVGVVARRIDGKILRYATFTYTYRLDNADFSLVAESSLDLQLWQDAALSTVVESKVFNGNGTRTVTLRETEPLVSGSAMRRFYRVRFLPLGLTFADWMDKEQPFDPLGDPDHDGVDNFTAFATGTDLLPDSQAAHLILRIAKFTVGGRTANYATLTYTLREGALGIALVVESSADLRTWSEASEDLTQVSSTLRRNGTRLVTVREKLPMVSLPRYYRVRLHSAEPWASETVYGSWTP